MRRVIIRRRALMLDALEARASSRCLEDEEKHGLTAA